VFLVALADRLTWEGMFRRVDVEKLKLIACGAEKSAAHRTTDVGLVLTVSGESSVVLMTP
jgi:hypothetical protein